MSCNHPSTTPCMVKKVICLECKNHPAECVKGDQGYRLSMAQRAVDRFNRRHVTRPPETVEQRNRRRRRTLEW